jgi:hypothetical protein
MFKELFKRWFGSTETSRIFNADNNSKKSIKAFRSFEEARHFIIKQRKNRTHKQLAKFLNRSGYRTVKGMSFTESSVQYYTKSENFINKRRNDAREYARKKRSKQLLESFLHYMRVHNIPIHKYDVSITSDSHEVQIHLIANSVYDFELLRENDCSLLIQIKSLSKFHFQKEVTIFYERSYKSLDEPFIA